MKLESRLGLLRLQNDITSCVDIYMQQDKQQTAGRWCWWTRGRWFGSSLIWFCFGRSSNLVWIWFVSVWTQSEQLHDWPMWIWSVSLGEYQRGGAYNAGRGRSLGSIGNMNKQLSLYYISVESDIYTTQTYILSTDLYFNNSDQHHHLNSERFYSSALLLLLFCSSCGFVLYNSRFYHLHIDSL